MIRLKKYVSDEIIGELPNWLIHFLWYLLENITQCDSTFSIQFILQHSKDGQLIFYQTNERLYQINIPCPNTIAAKVAVIREEDRLVMKLM